MDIKEEVRRRIAELTRFAYERGYRDGAQSALSEMEAIGAEDVAKHLSKEPAALKAIPGKKASARKPAKAQAKKAKPAKGKASAKPKAQSKPRGKAKTQTIQDAIQGLLDAKGEARREEVLTVAQAENSAITKFDLGNGLRQLVKQSKVRVSPDDSAVLLSAA